MTPQGWIAPLYELYPSSVLPIAFIPHEARGAGRDDRIALDAKLGPGDLRGLGEFRAVARLSNQLAAEGRADNANGLGRFLRDAAALYGVRGGQKSVDLARDDGRELEHCRDVRI